MNIIDMWQNALIAMVIVTGPFLLAALVVGLATSILQAATQLQENVISFVPKMAALGVVLAFGGRWVFNQILRFHESSMEAVVRLAQEAMQ